MTQADVLVVGGGPAGSTCAWRLHQAGAKVLVLDKATFPRGKLCAGWITPAVLAELRLDAAEYAQGRVLQPIRGFRVGRIGGPSLVVAHSQRNRSQGGEEGDRSMFSAHVVSAEERRLAEKWTSPRLPRERLQPQPMSYAVRRIELDDYLLRRCGARLELGQPVRSIRRADAGWIVNEEYAAPMLVAAGGHFCPVAKLLDQGGQSPAGPMIVSQEVEFPLDAIDPAARARCRIEPETPEIYFCDDLLGYGWCLRKGDHVNIGLGRANRQRLPQHAAEFCAWLADRGRIAGPLPPMAGHAYLLYDQSTRPLVADGLLWVGDAAGLAWPKSGEGIGPAIESGLLAADTILAARGNYRRECLDAYRQRIEARFGPRSLRPPREGPPSLLRRWAGRWLLGRRSFVRRVVLDRWFLHVDQAPVL